MKKFKRKIKALFLIMKGIVDNFFKKEEIKLRIKHSNFFDKKYYLNNLNNYNSLNIKPYLHYYEIGWKEGLNPSVRFDTIKYLKANPDVNMNPLFHYEKYGKKEGRIAFYVDEQYNHNYKKKQISRFIKRKISNIINYNLIKKNKNKRILVYAHVFYIFSIDEIIQYLKNLEKYNYDLIITCNDNKYSKVINERFLKFKKDTKVIICENRGYDIGPFFEMLKNININKYDVFFKLQSKGTFNRTNYIYNQIFRNRDWFEYMFESTLGAFYVHKNINLLSNDNNIGIIAANNLIINDPKHKENFTIMQLKKHDIKLIPNYNFVAGTVYAERACLLKKVKSLNLSIMDFEISERGYFSFAHAMERFLTGGIDKKYIIYGNNVYKIKKFIWKNVNNKLKNMVGVRLLDDKRFNLDDDLVLRYLEHAIVDNYEIITLKLKDIGKIYDNKRLSLEECEPYLYLTGNNDQYLDYCLTNRRTDYMHLSNEEFRKYAKKDYSDRFNKLIKSIDSDNYDSKKIIVVDKNNNLLDGQHRACYLLYKYGKNYKVKVLKIYENQINLNKIRPYGNKKYFK